MMTITRTAVSLIGLLFSGGLGACASARLGPPAEQAAASASPDGGGAATAAERADAGTVSATAENASTENEASGAEDSDEIDDGAETPGPAVEGQAYRHPLDTWTQRQIEDALAKNPESLGSMSLGYTNAERW
jgi:hypothetical protein